MLVLTILHPPTLLHTHTTGNIGLLLADFDDTCTERDTISVLLGAAVDAAAQNAAAAAAAADGGGDAAAAAAAGKAARQQQAAAVKRLADNYVAKQQALLDTLLPPPPPAAAGPESTAAAAAVPYHPQGLRAFCDALSSFDCEMNQVVVDAGALKGG